MDEFDDGLSYLTNCHYYFEPKFVPNFDSNFIIIFRKQLTYVDLEIDGPLDKLFLERLIVIIFSIITDFIL